MMQIRIPRAHVTGMRMQGTIHLCVFCSIVLLILVHYRLYLSVSQPSSPATQLSCNQLYAAARSTANVPHKHAES